MKIGDKVALHKVLFPEHKGQPEDEFTIVTITQVRNDVPMLWGKEKDGDGYRGVDDQGRQFELHWDSYPDDSSTPNWLWYRIDVPEAWADLTQGISLYPKLPEYFKDKDILGYCSVHKTLFDLIQKSLAQGQCFYCYLRSISPGHRDAHAEMIKRIDEENRIWKGW